MHKLRIKQMKKAKARQQNIRNLIKEGILCTIISIAVVSSTFGVAYASDIMHGINPTTENKTEPYYAIYDVISSSIVDSETVLTVELPNGELHDYITEDESINNNVEEVCFYITSENYDEWEVIAIR